MGKRTRLVATFLVAVATTVVVHGGLGGCGGDGDGDGSSAPPTVNVTGNWSGSWRSSTRVEYAGNITFLPLTQTGSMLSGQIRFTGSLVVSCFSGGALSVSGVLSGNSFTASLTAGGIRVDVDGSVTGNQMSGTYTVNAGGVCTGDTGTFSASR